MNFFFVVKINDKERGKVRFHNTIIIWVHQSGKQNYGGRILFDAPFPELPTVTIRREYIVILYCTVIIMLFMPNSYT